MQNLILIISLIVLSISTSGQQRYPGNYSKPKKLDDGIEIGSIRSAGFDPEILSAMTDSVSKGVYTNVHSILIFRDNKLVYEKYWPGKDFNRGFSLGIVNHDFDVLHDVRSVTKSVISAAVMIAINQGKIGNIDQPVFDFLPEYSKHNVGMKKLLTIRHLLDMSAGLEWNESLPYSDSLNSSVQKSHAPDPIEYILSRPMVDTPGLRFNYNGGCTQLLAAILEKATEIKVEKFTDEYLFKPLGILNYIWTKEKNGFISADAGLRMRSRDMLKFGIAYLNEGKWKGMQVIPAEGVKRSLQIEVIVPYSNDELQVGYSNQFWIYSETIESVPVNYVQAQGNGGQLIVIDKKNKMVVVLTSGNYGRNNLKKSSWNICYDFIYPALFKNNN